MSKLRDLEGPGGGTGGMALPICPSLPEGTEVPPLGPRSVLSPEKCLQALSPHAKWFQVSGGRVPRRCSGCHMGRVTGVSAHSTIMMEVTSCQLGWELERGDHRAPLAGTRLRLAHLGVESAFLLPPTAKSAGLSPRSYLSPQCLHCQHGHAQPAHCPCLVRSRLKADTPFVPP